MPKELIAAYVIILSMILVLIFGIAANTNKLPDEKSNGEQKDSYVIQNIRAIKDYKNNVTFFIDYAINGKEVTRWVPTAVEIDLIIARMERVGKVTWYGEVPDEN